VGRDSNIGPLDFKSESLARKQIGSVTPRMFVRFSWADSYTDNCVSHFEVKFTDMISYRSTGFKSEQRQVSLSLSGHKYMQPYLRSTIHLHCSAPFSNTYTLTVSFHKGHVW
jgi:hypothetical protein